MPGNNNKRILVCGGAGFIGSNFIRHMMQRHQGASVLNFDKLTYSGNLHNLHDLTSDPNYSFVQGDVANKTVLSKSVRGFRPNYIINFAAETHVDRSIHHGVEEFLKTNVWGVLNLLELTKASDVLNYVQVSTDEVYGTLDLEEKILFNEESPLAPNMPYAATKASGDLLCRAYYKTWRVPVVVTRCSNNYGPYQFPEKLIPFFILRALANKSLPVYGDGQHVRDWIHVEDHCRALELCLFEGRAGEVYNIGGDNQRKNLEIAKLILSHMRKDNALIEHVADRPAHDRRYAIDASKIKKELGWRPEINLKKGIIDTIEWYIQKKDWRDDVMTRAGKVNEHIFR